ncbi:indolepyruvate ferredoxin oxidoreductase family protein [Novosphingobium sp. FKTRR1]|uniref:indolepyruvate ferredoxin oxidoreductase family protein n=1 Tax=Novosphingobium sp. FKTRR1 TaxID=2879118 RepID=UPI001CF0224F|nr:indolepyruvate ferredoxin oxidoreductase family protein [Novosphingobium sp. FKTRR1]
MNMQPNAFNSDWRLSDRFDQIDGRQYLTGNQALVKLPLLQRALDQAAGLDTAGFISGYRGSPLGNFDTALSGQKQRLEQNGIHFVPGVNEELAATAVWGSQQANQLPFGARHDGVFAIWYGKGPGVDRAGDALKHGNYAGASRQGGVLVLAGDDHGGKSSTLVYQSDHALQSFVIPVLHPASVRDYFQVGLFGWALSRATGLWAGFKCVTDIIETTAGFDFDLGRIRFEPGEVVIPQQFRNPAHVMQQAHEEEALFGHRLPAALDFARINSIDEIVVAPPRGGLGLVAVGKAYGDLMQAMGQLGLDVAKLQALGLGIYKLQLAWPIEPVKLRAFASGCRELLIIEEKRAFVEPQVANALFNAGGDRPLLSGKRSHEGAALFNEQGELTPGKVRAVVVDRLDRLGRLTDELRAIHADLCRREEAALAMVRPTVNRTPAFCSGCPHNRSTKLPEGAAALAGIGCHTMAIYMPDRATMRPTQMGGEGANWIGMSTFVERPHVFQNLGDGTYFHSGILAIRAAVAAKVNITYKILFNDAVAMTGGQAVDGVLTVARIVAQLSAEGVSHVVVVTDNVADYHQIQGLPDHVEVKDREQLIPVEEGLARTPGVTALIYDQTCAAEKRRRRKQGKFPDPQKRIFINSAVCEGCGDCGRQSNCVSLTPVETPFGTKRRIDQSSCNKDYSCVDGFCPSFVTVIGGKVRSRAADPSPADAGVQTMPDDPPIREARCFNILVTGIGGTGVVTVGAIIGVAAHLSGKSCSLLDLTGLSQKNGAVLSHVRLALTDADIPAARIGVGETDAVIGCDLLVAAGPEAVKTYHAATSVALNTHLVAVAAFQQDRTLDLGGERALSTIQAATDARSGLQFDATKDAEMRFGDAIFANMIMLGVAYQLGNVPLPSAAIEAAIRLNGVAVDKNLAAFRRGRMIATSPGQPDEAIANTPPETPGETLEATIRNCAERLEAYQDFAYSQAFRDIIEQIRAAETRVRPGSTELALAAARNLAKLMAYKDEYEVARLFTDPDFARELQDQFEGDFTLRYNLAPPFLARMNVATGRPAKREFGGWMRPMLVLLAKGRRLRGTRLDPFGATEERKIERALVAEYRVAIEVIKAGLNESNFDLAVEALSLADQVRGYGPVKLAAIAQYRPALQRTLSKFCSAPIAGEPEFNDVAA